MTEHSPWIWVAFNVLIVGILALDLGIFHRKRREIPLRRHFGPPLAISCWLYASMRGFTNSMDIKKQ